MQAGLHYLNLGRFTAIEQDPLAFPDHCHGADRALERGLSRAGTERYNPGHTSYDDTLRAPNEQISPGAQEHPTAAERMDGLGPSRKAKECTPHRIRVVLGYGTIETSLTRTCDLVKRIRSEP